MNAQHQITAQATGKDTAYAKPASGDDIATVRANELKVLLVDDDADFRHLVAEGLQQWPGKVKIVQAGNVSQALMILSGNKVDLIVADFDMPAATGLDLLRHVRAFPPSAQTPFVLCTGFADEVIHSAALRAGATAVVPKPLGAWQDLSEIMRQFRKYLKDAA